MTGTQPEALRLADQLIGMSSMFKTPSHERGVCNGAIQELRHLHDENARLRAGLEHQIAAHDLTLDNLRLADHKWNELYQAIQKLHAAKGRYHTQLAICDLFDLVGAPNERPKK